MEKYKVELILAAYDDLNDIVDYILLVSPTAAESMLNKMTGPIKHLENFPSSGTKVLHFFKKSFDFRMIIIGPYIDFYRFIMIVFMFLEFCTAQEIIFNY